MLTEYVMKTEELLELSRGTLRYSIIREPIRYSDMSGRGVITSPMATLYLKYQALSLAEDPQRIITLKIELGEFNQYGEEYGQKLRTIRETAPDEILQYLDKDGFVKGTHGTPGHRQRQILEGGFE